MTEYVLGEVPEGAGERTAKKKNPEVKLKVIQVPPMPDWSGERPKLRRPDLTGLARAKRQASTIEAAWRRAGHDIRVDIVAEVINHDTHYKVVMPDLINGLPKKEVC